MLGPTVRTQTPSCVVLCCRYCRWYAMMPCVQVLMHHRIIPPRKAHLFASALEHEKQLQARVVETEAITDRQALYAFEERLKGYYVSIHSRTYHFNACMVYTLEVCKQ